MKIDQVRLKGNASFAIREGWLSKGLRCVAEDPCAFLGNSAIQRLGVGSAMVKSIRHWMQACGLTVEVMGEKRRRVQRLTDLGSLIHEKDPWFEDWFSLCLVHYHIATSEELATVWYLLFNVWKIRQFDRSRMTEDLLDLFHGMAAAEAKNYSFAESSFRSDCATALRTYVAETSAQGSPEDNMQCPLADLGLFIRNEQGRYVRMAPPRSRLHRAAVLYVILDRMEKQTQNGGVRQVSLRNLLEAPCNAGRIFHLDFHGLNMYLDELEAEGSLSVKRTAGLNMVVPADGLTALQVAQRYYEGGSQNETAPVS